jgi:DNA invertase Pin-like site-specific DNA recombinase
MSSWRGLSTGSGVRCRTCWRFLSEIHAKGVERYLHQQGIDTTTPSGKAMFQMMGVFAELERATIRERVLAGLKRVRSHPKLPGIGWCPGSIRCDNQR